MKTDGYIMEPLEGENEIDKSQYTLSLMAQGIQKGMIQPQYVQMFQQNTLEILKKLLVKYTFGESSSVKVEVAENIMRSIYYVMDVYLARSKTPYESITQLEDMGIQKVYEEGLTYLRCMVESCKEKYEQVKASSLELDIIAYQDTVKDGLDSFFKLYNVLFGAHDTMCSIDYPLAMDDMSLEGILYIKQYIDHIAIENSVCQCFSIENIESILENYGALYKLDYREALVNVFEIVINNYVFRLMAGYTSRELQITKIQYDVIQKELDQLSDLQVSSLVDDLFDRLVITLEIQEDRVIDYIQLYKEKFLNQLLQHRKMNLGYLIVVDQEKVGNNVYVIDDKEKMDDEDFKKLVELIIDCQTPEDKVALIRSKVESLVDFVDILKADCLFEDEYTRFYETVEDMELVILGKIIYEEALRLERISIMVLDHLELEEPWQWYFDNYIKQLESDRFSKIEYLINHYDINM